jgi:hypothetical protein
MIRSMNMQKVISFSLWGNNQKYMVGAIKNAELQKHIYPGWKCVFYCDSVVPKNIEDILVSLDCNIIRLDCVGDWSFATKRFLALDQDDVEVVIFRDADSRLNLREKSAVEQWLQSDKSLHIMKDHPHHGGFPILAGMWGMKKLKFNFKMEALLKIYNFPIGYHYDQHFLKNYIWNFYSNDCIIHDEFFGGKSFPVKRNGMEYVGKPFEFDDKPSLPDDERYFL